MSARSADVIALRPVNTIAFSEMTHRQSKDVQMSFNGHGHSDLMR